MNEFGEMIERRERSRPRLGISAFPLSAFAPLGGVATQFVAHKTPMFQADCPTLCTDCPIFFKKPAFSICATFFAITRRSPLRFRFLAFRFRSPAFWLQPCRAAFFAVKFHHMNCIVTAGPTFEPLDDVRRLTNFSTGRLGTELANFLTARGHTVTLLIGESATWPGERQARTVKVFSSTKDLRAKLKSFSRKKVDAIFHAAAVSDFAFGKMSIRDADGKLKAFTPTKKISTRGGIC